MFDQRKILEKLESLRRSNGAFIAAPTPDYAAMWIRDHLYCTFAYRYLEDYTKFNEGLWVIFDLFKRYDEKLVARIASPDTGPRMVFHAKFDADTFAEITPDDQWSHHQLDAIGLFLYLVAYADFHNTRVIRDAKDLETLQRLVHYLRSVEYWEKPDYGMWEECLIRHASSIGAVVSGLTRIKQQRLASVPDSLIALGERRLNEILPYESRDRCDRPHHSHDCDAAQLTLIWPYHVIVRPESIEEIVGRIVDGHDGENGERHRLLQTRGCNRYWGDDYYRSTDRHWRGISAEWPMFKFWLSIVSSQLRDFSRATYWFRSGMREITPVGEIPEAYQNGQPNDHTPLAWAHAICLIAFAKLPEKTRQRLAMP